MNFCDLPRANRGQRRKELWHERKQVADVVAFGSEHRDSETAPAQILLKLQVLVHRYQEIEPASHRVKQFAVGKGGPPSRTTLDTSCPVSAAPSRHGMQLSSNIRTPKRPQPWREARTSRFRARRRHARG